MTKHQNYFEIVADSYYDLGLREGELFGDFLRATIEERKRDDDWEASVEQAGAYVQVTTKAFPQLMEEAHGYAEGARVCFQELWLLLLEDELVEAASERCTTAVTNGGMLIGHNEDWDRDAKNSICLLRKTIGDVSIFELFYLNTLGGNSISFNSHGFLHAVNSLTHTDAQVGVPRNVIARWLSETADPDGDYDRLTKIQRASGYHHTWVNSDGHIWSLECSAMEHVFTRPKSPFVHTNHFLSHLSNLEGSDQVPGTRARYRCVSRNVRETMSLDEMREMLDDASDGKRRGVFNRNTIARAIFDMERRQAHIWLLREKNKGWIAYDI